MRLTDLIETFKGHDKVIFKLTGIGEMEYNTVEFKDAIDTIEALQQENEQLQEFANAKADGRLKILPAKPGDIIYRPEALQFCWVITKVEIYEDEIVFIDDSDNIFRPDDIGKTVFLTHEEAEKVLEAKRRGGKKDDLQNYLKF